jgi:hypothetical protein
MAGWGLASHQIRMGELVNEQNAWTTCEGRIEIELLAYDATIFDGQRREAIEAFEQALGFDAAVWLDVADYYIGTRRGASVVRRFEHGVGLSYTGGSAEKNAKPAALGAGLFGLNVSEKLVWIRPRVVHLMRCAQLLRGIAQGATPEEQRRYAPVRRPGRGSAPAH